MNRERLQFTAGRVANRRSDSDIINKQIALLTSHPANTGTLRTNEYRIFANERP